MSDTPRTDAATDFNGALKIAVQLERENEALLKLLVEAKRELLLRVSYDNSGLIPKIDAAIKEQSHD